MTRSVHPLQAPCFLAVPLVLAMTGCFSSGSVEVATGTAAAPATHVPSAVATDVLTGVEAGTRLEVRYLNEEAREAAGEALHLAREAVAHLAHALNRPVGGSALLVLYRADAQRPGNLRAPTHVVAPVPYLPGKPLTQLPATWNWVHALIHEMWHAVEPRSVRADRWLSDGLPEWVAVEFLRQRSPEAFLARWQVPPPVALVDEYPPTPWSPASLLWLRRWERLARRDPDLAIYLGQREARRYAAAYALVDRWLAAMAAVGSAEPLRQLVRELGRQGRVDFAAANELCRRLTGRTMAQLAAYSGEEKGHLARQGWAAATSLQPAAILWGLRVMTAFGPPPEADPQQLVIASQGEAWRPLGCLGVFELSRVVAAWGEEATVTSLYQAHRADEAAALRRCALAPSLWRRWAARDRAEATAELGALLMDEKLDLRWKEEANQVLEELTGRRTGWRVDAPPEAREAAARGRR